MIRYALSTPVCQCLYLPHLKLPLINDPNNQQQIIIHSYKTLPTGIASDQYRNRAGTERQLRFFLSWLPVRSLILCLLVVGYRQATMKI